MLPAIKLHVSAHRKLSVPFSFPKYSHSRVLLWERSSTLDQSAIERLSASVSAPPFLSLSLPTAATTYAHDASSLESSIGSPPSVPITQWNLDHRHIQLLNAIACITAISATWLFFSAIPALLAFKKGAESLEKLLDVTREELPPTMAAVRLSGMEISDLTMELSDLGQEITQGVRNSTRAVRQAEDRLRRLTTMAPAALVQEKATPKTEMMEPVIARTARNLREGIVNGRAMLQLFFSLSRLSRWAMSYMSARRKKP